MRNYLIYVSLASLYFIVGAAIVRTTYGRNYPFGDWDDRFMFCLAVMFWPIRLPFWAVGYLVGVVVDYIDGRGREE